jgi:hypothetical protein
MPNGSLSTESYAAVIADLRAKREEIDRTISILEGMMQIGPSGESQAPVSGVSEAVRVPVPSLVSNVAAPTAPLSGIGEAVVRVLQEHERSGPLTTRQVTDLLIQSGFELTTANPINNVWSALDNRAKVKKDIRRAGKNWQYCGGDKGSLQANGAHQPFTSGSTFR